MAIAVQNQEGPRFSDIVRSYVKSSDQKEMTREIVVARYHTWLQALNELGLIEGETLQPDTLHLVQNSPKLTDLYWNLYLSHPERPFDKNVSDEVYSLLRTIILTANVPEQSPALEGVRSAETRIEYHDFLNQALEKLDKARNRHSSLIGKYAYQKLYTFLVDAIGQWERHRDLNEQRVIDKVAKMLATADSVDTFLVSYRTWRMSEKGSKTLFNIDFAFRESQRSLKDATDTQPFRRIGVQILMEVASEYYQQNEEAQTG